MCLFFIVFEKHGMFSKYFEEIPRAAPGGRCRRRRQGFCFIKIFGKLFLRAHPYFSKWHFSFLQITTIYKGTQVTTPGLGRSHLGLLRLQDVCSRSHTAWGCRGRSSSGCDDLQEKVAQTAILVDLRLLPKPGCKWIGFQQISLTIYILYHEWSP